MDNISTYQGALEVFRKVGWVGTTENCIFGAIVDSSKSTEFTASMAGYGAFGVAGYLAGNIIGQERDIRINDINDYIFVLINLTEKGIGILPVIGGGMKIDPARLTPRYDGFVCFTYNEISQISAKNFYGIRKSVKAITITLVNKYKLHFNANMSEKKLPYQENSMNYFVGKYQK